MTQLSVLAEVLCDHLQTLKLIVQKPKYEQGAELFLRQKTALVLNCGPEHWEAICPEQTFSEKAKQFSQ